MHGLDEICECRASMTRYDHRQCADVAVLEVYAMRICNIIGGFGISNRRFLLFAHLQTSHYLLNQSEKVRCLSGALKEFDLPHTYHGGYF